MESKPIDIPAAVAFLIPNAKYRSANTYDDLVATWTDDRRVPTLGALQAAWQQAQIEQKKTDAQSRRGRRLVELIGDGNVLVAITKLAEALSDTEVAEVVKQRLDQAKQEHPDP